jgi:hypothetical protein
MWRVVCDEETSKNEEAKARYWAVKIHPQWGVTPGKQTNNKLYTVLIANLSYFYRVCRGAVVYCEVKVNVKIKKSLYRVGQAPGS